MHHFLPLQRLATHAPGRHHAKGARQRGASQSDSSAFAGSISPELCESPGGVGHRFESASGCCGSSVSRFDARDSTPDSNRTAPGLTGKIRNLTKLGVLILIRSYQLFLSPVLPPACRFYPTCSAYAYEAVEKWGIGRGGWLTLRRLLRCHPLGKQGYDPVP